MRLAYLDLVGGAAGDMLLGALLHAGASLDGLSDLVASFDLGASLEVSTVERQGIGARHVVVGVPDAPQPERHLSCVLEVIERSSASPRVRELAGQVFGLLAEAEAEVHETTPESVHFHEVGAIDAIVDVTCTLAALEQLEVARVECSHLPVAGGTVQAAHGTLPLPAPAVLAIAQRSGLVLEGRAGRGELVTPTAAALLGALSARCGPLPALIVEGVGYGAGTRVAPAGQPPNLTRCVLGRAPADEATPGEVVALEVNLDDQSAEQTGYLCERLRERGALEVYVTAVQGKKGRPAWKVSVLADPARAGALEDLLLTESSTLGVRSRREVRRVLPRESIVVQTPYGPLRAKVALRPDGRRDAAPEFDDCARAAREQGVPLTTVFAAVRAAADGNS